MLRRQPEGRRLSASLNEVSKPPQLLNILLVSDLLVQNNKLPFDLSSLCQLLSKPFLNFRGFLLLYDGGVFLKLLGNLLLNLSLLFKEFLLRFKASLSAF